MLARTKQLGKRNLALKYGEAKKRLWQSERTGDHRASIDSDVDALRLNHEGTRHLPLAAGVNRGCLRFAGTYIGEPSKVSGALKKSRPPFNAGPNSRLSSLSKAYDPVSRLTLGATSSSARALHPAPQVRSAPRGRKEIMIANGTVTPRQHLGTARTHCQGGLGGWQCTSAVKFSSLM
jgi:hypothetical protein